jgi:SagB-type dehydrogenase family enzyme
MRKQLLLAIALLMAAACGPAARPAALAGEPAGIIPLPAPTLVGQMSLETALAQRRSVREFSARPLTEAELGQLLWAAQGITGGRGYRTAPSAGALYPLEVYVATADGLFHYEVDRHALAVVDRTDLRPALYEAALRQAAVSRAPAVFVIAAVYERTAVKYGAERSPRYVHLEAGHATQNLLLQAVALELGAVPIGAFEDAGVQQALGLPADQQPLYLIPVGQP